MSVPPRRRSALIFALDVTGGPKVVYRVVVFLQDLVRRLEAAPGLTTRARIDLVLFDAASAAPVPGDQLLAEANALAVSGWPTGARLGPLVEQVQRLPYEDGGFHVFILLTRDLAPGWEPDVLPLHQNVASVTGLCCGPDASPPTATALSKSPGGTRIVNPLDLIRAQFQSIAAWLIENFADRPALPPPEPTPALPAPAPAARWRVVEPADQRDAVPHTRAERREGWAGWRLVGASRRGKLHAHEGTFRDDEFALGAYKGWNLIAVADGAGSVRLSRVGARAAVEAAIGGLTAGIDRHWLAAPPDDPDAALRAIATDGLQAAHAAVHAEARRRNIAPRDLSSTLLLLAHSPPMQAEAEGAHLLATAQVGDGMLAVIDPDGTIEVLGTAEKGFYSGETVFLPGMAPEKLAHHAHAFHLASAPRLVLVMTDGVADDLVPLARQMPTLVRGIQAALSEPAPDLALLATIGYEKRDSADDRTLVVLHQPGNGD